VAVGRQGVISGLCHLHRPRDQQQQQQQRAGTARHAVGAASTKTRISVRQRSHRSAASLLNDAATKAAMYTFKLLTFLLTTHAVDRLRR